MSVYVVPQNLAGLPGMPTTERNCLTKLNKLAEGVLNKKRRREFGKGFEYHVSLLPKETREALMLRQVMATAPAVVEVPKVVEGEMVGHAWDDLTETQRDCALARLAFVREIEQMSKLMSQNKAIAHMAQLCNEGRLPDRLAPLVAVANDRRAGLSVASLNRWLGLFRNGGRFALVPGRPQAKIDIPGWWPVFAPFWQKPQKPSMAEAYRDYVDKTASPHASLRQVSYFLMGKLSEEARNWGRMSDQELKAFQAFKRLSFDHLDPNDIWQIDGHCFDAQVINPLTGQAFKPEITVIIDWATRVWVGFSINLSESSISTVDAIRDAVASRGMFKLLYTDNGPGFKDNALVDRVCDVLGGTLTRALPYNSQAKGLVERFHHTALVRLAKRYPSYIGADMDKQAGTKAHKLSLALLKEGTREAEQRRKLVMPELMTFYRDLLSVQLAYNDTPHSALPQVRDYETGVQRHMTPNEIWQQKCDRGFEPMVASVADIEMMCRPTKVVVTRRGEIKFIKQVYFSHDLVPLHGEDVVIRYDFRDGSRVWAFNLDGELICEALFQGNSVDAKPQSMIDDAAEKRMKGQLGRLSTKAETLTGMKVDIVPRVNAQEQDQQQNRVEELRQQGKALIAQYQQEQEAAAEQFMLPRLPSQKYALWESLFQRLQVGEELTEEATRWVRGYPRSTEWLDAREMRIAFGETVISYQQQSA